MRLILTIRDPVERAWSAARRVRSRLAKENWGCEFHEVNDEEFYAFWRLEHAYRPERGKKRGKYVPGLKRGNYDRIIQNWLSVFPEEQLLVCFFEDIAENPRQFLVSVFRHLGVRADVDWTRFPEQKIINRNPQHPIPERFRRFSEDMYSPEIEALRQRYGKRIDSLGWGALSDTNLQ